VCSSDLTVAAADDQYLLRLTMGEERHVRHHLVIDELITGGELDNTVQHHHATEIAVLEDNEMLALGLAIEENAIRL
jgi:hypothetical protein